MRALHLVPDEPDEYEVPDFRKETRAQIADAIDLLAEDTSTCPRVPWIELNEAMGPLRAWNWWLIAAQFGQGKSTVLMSLVDHWIRQGRPVYMLPLEQPPDVMRSILAAMREGLDPARVLKGEWGELPPDAVSRITADLTWQQGPGSDLLYFNQATDVGVDELHVAVAEAKVFGAEAIIIDHLHQLDTGLGNGYEGLKRLCKAINEFAKHYRIPIVTAAQLHRGERDRVARHMPPNPMSVQGGDIVSQLAHVAIGAYRPFAGPLSRSDEVLVRKGEGDIRQYLEPNCVGFHVMKHRLDGQQQGRIVKLRYEYGRITDPTWEQVTRWKQQEAPDAPR